MHNTTCLESWLERKCIFWVEVDKFTNYNKSKRIKIPQKTRCPLSWIYKQPHSQSASVRTLSIFPDYTNVWNLSIATHTPVQNERRAKMELATERRPVFFKQNIVSLRLLRVVKLPNVLAHNIPGICEILQPSTMMLTL